MHGSSIKSSEYAITGVDRAVDAALRPKASGCRSWKCPVNQKQLAPKTMQLAVVMTEESRVICRDFGADLHLIAGSGLKHRR
jgi:hypothetical protein